MSSPNKSPIKISNLAVLASRRNSLSSNFLELPSNARRRGSLPVIPGELSEEFTRLRSFDIKAGRVHNRGDTIVSRHSSRNSQNSSCCHSSLESLCSTSEWRVLMLGDAGVGKSALVNQFTTSEYINTYDASLDDEFGEHSVCVLLDDEESELIFIDPSDMSYENSVATYNPECVIVVYSITDRHSFLVATEILKYTKSNKNKILVGNKSDLQRSRVVSIEEGKSLATNLNAKFIETSSGIQHNVDELLVGTLKQCRLRAKQKKKPKHIHEIATQLISKLLLFSQERQLKRSKSCQNLFS